MDTDSEYFSFHALLLFFAVFLSVFSVPSTVFLLILLIIISGLISGSEVAYFSLDRRMIEEIRQDNKRSSLRILNLIENPRRLLATILITNNFINISIVILSDLLLKQTLDQNLLRYWSEQIVQMLPSALYVGSESIHLFINFIFAVVLASFILLLFGEVLPKIYARKNSIYLARFMSMPLVFMNRLTKPFASFLIRFSSFFEKRIERKSLFQNLELRSDLDKAIEITASNSAEAKEEVDLLKRVLKFNEVPVKQIMKSRVDVVAIDKETSFENVLEIIKSSGYSRIPVYEEDFDNIKGILYAKDLIPYIDRRGEMEWYELIKTNVFYVPDSKMIDALLREFQSKRTHMAIVVDEYGGNAGIVTLEDVMEEVIGEIKDEFDDEFEQDFYKIDEDNYIFEGKTLINDVCKIMQMDDRQFDEYRGESDSIAGLILEVLGILPIRNQRITIADVVFTVMAVNQRRIEQVKVSKKVISKRMQNVIT